MLSAATLSRSSFDEGDMETDLDHRHGLVILPGEVLDSFFALPRFGGDNRRIGFGALPASPVFLHQFFGLGDVDIAADNQHAVVGNIEMVLELLAILERHFRLKVFLPTDHRMLIGMSRVS